MAVLIPVFALGLILVQSDKMFAKPADDTRTISEVNLNVAKMKCGTPITVTGYEGSHYLSSQQPRPKVTCATEHVWLDESGYDAPWFITNGYAENEPRWYPYYTNEAFEGSLTPGSSWLYIDLYTTYEESISDDEYVFADKEELQVKVNGKTAKITSVRYYNSEATAIIQVDESMLNHDWDNGKITKQPTATTPGEKTFTCKGCGKMRTEPIPALGGKSPMLKMTSKGAKAMNLKVSAVPGASGYEIFMSRCNGPEKRAPKKVKTFNKGKSFTWTKGGLKPNVVYKAYARAYKIEDGKKVYIAKSPLMHALTNAAGGRRTNPAGVTVKKAKVSLAAGKSAQIKAKVKSLIPGRALPAASHGKKLRYMSSDSSVATVSASGKITGKAAGKCKVYAYAINGACKAVNVTVK